MTLGLGFGRGRGMGLGAVGESAIGRASGTSSDPTGGVVSRIAVDDCASCADVFGWISFSFPFRTALRVFAGTDSVSEMGIAVSSLVFCAELVDDDGMLGVGIDGDVDGPGTAFN